MEGMSDFDCAGCATGCPISAGERDHAASSSLDRPRSRNVFQSVRPCCPTWRTSRPALDRAEASRRCRIRAFRSARWQKAVKVGKTDSTTPNGGWPPGAAGITSAIVGGSAALERLDPGPDGQLARASAVGPVVRWLPFAFEGRGIDVGRHGQGRRDLQAGVVGVPLHPVSEERQVGLSRLDAGVDDQDQEVGLGRLGDGVLAGRAVPGRLLAVLDRRVIVDLDDLRGLKPLHAGLVAAQGFQFPLDRREVTGPSRLDRLNELRFARIADPGDGDGQVEGVRVDLGSRSCRPSGLACGTARPRSPAGRCRARSGASPGG